MSFRTGLLRLVVATAPFAFFLVATQTRAQSQDENANAAAPLYKTASVKLSKSNIHAGGTTKIGPDELTATNEPPQALSSAHSAKHATREAGNEERTKTNFMFFILSHYHIH